MSIPPATSCAKFEAEVLVELAEQDPTWAAKVSRRLIVLALEIGWQPSQYFAIRRTPPIMSTQPRLRQIVAWCGSNPNQP